MVQQKKITSRPMTKALGTASILSMAIAGANMANALETDFGVEYRATAFALQNEAPVEGYGSDTDDGLAHLIRLKSNFKHESGVSLITSIELAGDRWRGDDRDTQTADLGAFNPGNTGDNVRLDLGYVQMPFGNNIIRVGRQASNWNNCFLVCDDRRDRVLGLFPTSIGNVLALYDRRQDTTRNQNQDDGDEIALGLATRAAGMDMGALWIHWFKNYEGDLLAPTGEETPAGEPGAVPYVVQGVHIISPYISGNLVDTVDFTVGFNYVFNGSVEAPGATDQYFTEPSWSQYVRLGTSVGIADLDFQYVGAQDGGLISSGFDTYSSVVNTNPESTANAASLYTMGGTFGLKDYDERLFIGRASFDVTPQLKVMGSVGHLTIDNGNDDDSSMVYDVQAHYQINEAVKTWLTAGMLTKNDVGRLSGNSLASVGGDWENDDAIAVTANLSVSF